MPQKREAMQRATANEAQGVADASAATATGQAAQAADLSARLARVDGQLAALGVGATRGEPLSFLLGRTLRQQAVHVVSLRALGIQELNLALPADATATAAAAVVDPTADTVAGGPADGAAATSLVLYRHRYELTLGGSVDQLTAAVGGLVALRLLSNLETGKRKLLQVVFFGQPELDTPLRATECRSLVSRIDFSARMAGLGRGELRHHLCHRMAVAG